MRRHEVVTPLAHVLDRDGATLLQQVVEARRREARRETLPDADALAADIGGVYSVSRYNAATQDLTWRLPGVSGDNFAVRPGYPYVVCLDETAPPVWP